MVKLAHAAEEIPSSIALISIEQIGTNHG